jgi:hypothetical protein
MTKHTAATDFMTFPLEIFWPTYRRERTPQRGKLTHASLFYQPF